MEKIKLTSKLLYKVDGIKNSCLYDLPNQKYYRFPKDTDIADFLESKGYCFEVPQNTERQFRELDLAYASPHLIKHVHLDAYSSEFLDVLNQLENNIHICVNIDQNISVNDMVNLLEKLKFHTLDISLIPIKKKLKKEDLTKLLRQYYNVMNFYMYGENDLFRINDTTVICATEIPKKFTLTKDDMFVNMDYFLEANNFNPAFNQRLVVDRNGFIKNHIDQKENFGHIDSYNFESLKQLLKSEKFQKLWHSKKDTSETCMHCEYRYACFDNRQPISKDDKTWYFEEECTYNPTLGIWKNEDEHSKK